MKIIFWKEKTTNFWTKTGTINLLFEIEKDTLFPCFLSTLFSNNLNRKVKQNRTDLKFRHKVVDIRSRGWWRFRKRKILATETIIYLQFLGKIICKIRFHLFPFICAFCLNADRFIKFMNLWLENCMKFFSNEKLYFFYLCEWKIRINFHKIWR